MCSHCRHVDSDITEILLIPSEGKIIWVRCCWNNPGVTSPSLAAARYSQIPWSTISLSSRVRCSFQERGFECGRAWCLSTCASISHILQAKYGSLPRHLAVMRLAVFAGLWHLGLSVSFVHKWTNWVMAVSSIINLNDRAVLQCLVSLRRCHNMSRMCTGPSGSSWLSSIHRHASQNTGGSCCSKSRPGASSCVRMVARSVHRSGVCPSSMHTSFTHISEFCSRHEHCLYKGTDVSTHPGHAIVVCAGETPPPFSVPVPYIDAGESCATREHRRLMSVQRYRHGYSPGMCNCGFRQ